jgi:hypothetical protein
MPNVIGIDEPDNVLLAPMARSASASTKAITSKRSLPSESDLTAAARIAVADLRISPIVIDGLMASGIENAGELASRTARWLHDHVSYAPGQRLGVHSIREIRTALREVGLKLGHSPTPRPGQARPPAAPIDLDPRVLAACALSLRELVWNGLDRELAERLSQCGFSCAGDLACRSPARLQAELQVHTRQRLMPKRFASIRLALRSVGLDQKLTLPEGWRSAATRARARVDAEDAEPSRLIAKFGVDALSAFSLSIEELGLSNRPLWQLQQAGIRTAGDLARRMPEELLELRNLGATSIAEIRGKLHAAGLDLGMRVPTGWEKASSVARERLAKRGSVERTLEDEIARMLRVVPSDALRAALKRCHGWNGRPPMSEDEASERLGVTTWVLRDGTKKLAWRVRSASMSLPILEASVECLASLAPSDIATAAKALRSEGLVRARFHPGAVVRAAQVRGLEKAFDLVGDDDRGWQRLLKARPRSYCG